MNGTYSEKLKTGGEIQITSSDWKIRYYFPGPDLRYNGTWVTIPGKKISEYMNAWAKNFLEYCKLKETIPKGGTFTKAGLMDMTINVGGYRDGVCLKLYHMPINTEKKLEAVLEDYDYAQKCADRMMKVLSMN